jgi:hypothetical protein
MSNRARSLLLLSIPLIFIFLSACGSGAAAPTQNPRYATIKVLSTQTHLIDGDITVVGALENNDKSAHDITLRADFLDPGGKSIGYATGVAEDVGAGKTANFEIHGKVDPAQFGTSQVIVVGLNEQK